ncbi:uncharacterized protein DSM5745_00793 [Aspergillus mulundensis]|uniref:Uncharacterized protein n=1 Tax=Aspergillus mulundensis TaxID=1810919 RepID=A0A3D8T4T8_9EURO|nr:hypothetical protein DSM5745_00793 [Aspergillus mulundensis]RDW93471.1 hypothetical protein DSM5745_00793 [Aspergillus mulundensis]
MTDIQTLTLSARAAFIAWRLVTNPWFVMQRTVQRILDIDDPPRQTARLVRWQADKKVEYQYVGVVGSLVASSVSGSLQWAISSSENTFWLVLAFWYGALALTLFCVIGAFYTSILVSSFDLRDDGNGDVERLLLSLRGQARNDEDGGGMNGPPRRRMLFVLQAPIMLLSYSILSYLVGLLLWIVAPLWRVGVFENGQLWVSLVHYSVVQYERIKEKYTNGIGCV